jgi:CRP-like cAMP-binding protein
VVVDGRAAVIRDGETSHPRPGDFFGELSVLDGRPRTAQVIADGPTTCLALASWDFEAVLLAEPRVVASRSCAARVAAARPDRRHPH